MWEARSLYFVAAGAPIFFIYPPAAMAIGGFGTLVVVVMVSTTVHIGALWGNFVGNSLRPIQFYPPPQPPGSSDCTAPSPFSLARHLLYRTPFSRFS